MPLRAKLFIILTAAVGIAVVLNALVSWNSTDLLKFSCYLAIGILASTMKVRLPGIESTMSVYFLFVLLGVMELPRPDTVAIGCAAALVQSLWKTKQRPEPVKVLFNVVCMTAPTIYLTYALYHLSITRVKGTTPLSLLVATFSYFLINTVMVAIVIALSSRSSLRSIWRETSFWTLPYYLIGAFLVGLIHLFNGYFGWQNGLLILPFMYLLYRAYNVYLGRLEDEKERVVIEAAQVAKEKGHVENLCALHLRTIEGLAMAVDAKYHHGGNRLHRVRIYAMELAKDLGLVGQELDALRAATLLYDIGKLAVPDQIINKPGRLTPEEIEKLNIHAAVGAEILERVAFPYPVAEIVRSHHEKWNGKGYPDGLKGEEIPIGARILAAVDSLNAIASDRQYRKALPLDDAMRVVAESSGESFDPKVIEILQRRYMELESLAVSQEGATNGERVFDQIVDSDQPVGGFAKSNGPGSASQADFVSCIASARQEAHTLFELSQDLGNSLSLDETLSLVAMRLRKLVPYDAVAVFLRQGDLLQPGFVSGESFKQLSSLTLRVGQGLCGWVAENSRAIVNGNPQLDFGILDDAVSGTGLRSALAVPLEGANGLVGVLALYQAEPDAFTSDHLRVLQVIMARIGYFVENALKYRDAESSATIDFLTGLANARALYLHLDQEVARSRQQGTTFAIMVCDLDGFKQINDLHGHLAGDKVLKVFAHLMQAACRNYDFVARMGGDEFVIIAPNMPEEAMSQRASLLNDMARQAGLDVCGKECLSVSVGVAFFPLHGTEPEGLLAEADRAMYSAKQSQADARNPMLLQSA
jgi:diguanylate cyclase (GGDEF)-like protein/putative nucleotidyltransferase with HDIG domain